MSTVSVSHDGQLLVVGDYTVDRFYIYNNSGSYVSTIHIPENDTMDDAAWTPHGDNIVVTSTYRPPLWVMSVNGDVISKTELDTTSTKRTPEKLSVSPDGIIYAILHSGGIFESRDDGKAWTLLINKHDDVYMYEHAVRVSINNNSYDVWTIVRIDYYYQQDRLLRSEYRLRIYTILRATDKAPTWRDLAFPQSVRVGLDHFSQLTFDGHSHVYVSENESGVYVWSTDGQYVCQLPDAERNIRSMTVDTQRHVLYIGHRKGYVSVFTRPSSN